MYEEPFCGFCQPGYTLIETTKTCVPSSIPGCAIYERAAGCLACDVVDGYSAQPVGYCKKTGVEVSKGEFLVSDRLLKN